jgi:hypothetical protein
LIPAAEALLHLLRCLLRVVKLHQTLCTTLKLMPNLYLQSMNVEN